MPARLQQPLVPGETHECHPQPHAELQQLRQALPAGERAAATPADGLREEHPGTGVFTGTLLAVHTLIS